MRSLCVFALFAVAAAALSGQEQRQVLDSINQVRASVYPPASPSLAPLSWDEELATRAADWAAKCVVAHNPSNRFLRTETLWASHGNADVTFSHAVEGWSHESRVFSWNLDTIREAKNYTAMVWQNTTSVGCAQQDCGGSIGTIFHCVFDPRGNYPGLLPYSTTCHPKPDTNCAHKCGRVWDGCTMHQCAPCNEPFSLERRNKRAADGQCFTLKGCTNSDPNEPILTGAKYTDDKAMTVEKCAQFCINKGYSYAGLVNGSTCVCDWNFGENDSNQCTSKCPGNQAQSCGGQNKYLIYNVEKCISQPACKNNACLAKSDLQWRTGLTISNVPGCINYCAQQGYSYMGISKVWCLCANSYTTNKALPTARCNNFCGDNSTCGSTDDSVVSVYSTVGCSAKGYEYTPTFDWRKKGNVVGAVRNQASCGTCWSFASTSALESAWAINYNRTAPVLSEQQITACSKQGGCGGGNNGDAWGWVQKNGGQAYSNQVDPFQAKDSNSGARCLTTKSEVTIAPNAPNTIVRAKGSEDAIVKALEYGPVYMGITLASWFGGYSGGVYIDDNWATTQGEGGHAMTIVGYGTDSKTKQDYWIVKNQWDITFGLNGYVLWARNRAGGTGGILNSIAHPNIPVTPKDKTLFGKQVQIRQVSSGNCVTANTWFDGGELTLAPCAGKEGQVFTIANNGVDEQYTLEISTKKGWFIDSWYANKGESVHCASSGTGDKSRITFIIKNLGSKQYQINGVGNSYSFSTNGDGKLKFLDYVVSGPTNDGKWVLA